ncbi:MAG: hypothetical protein JWO58_53 [Chitinophagaceae bacterium]|nr:hypothetical protein [Chitinophagaceae bacterium]
MLYTQNVNRKLNNNLLLGASTAAAAAMVNVAGVMVFFAYTSNITGHVATLAQEVVKGHWYQTGIVFIWLMMFFGGSFVAQLLITGFQKKGAFISHAAPIILETLSLLFIGIYGHLYYHESLKETEILVASLLFCMGLQNGMVAILSGNQVKTTHLTGLITDLGREVGASFFLKYRTPQLKEKLKLHVTILAFYFIGGVLGGYLFLSYDFQVFYVVVALLTAVLYFHLKSLLIDKPLDDQLD